MAHDDEQSTDQGSGSEKTPSAPPPFASRAGDDASDDGPSTAAPQAPVTVEPSAAGAPFEDARRQIRAQAEQARSDVQQLLLSENERLRAELSSAVKGLEQTLNESARQRIEAEIGRLTAEVRETTKAATEQISSEAKQRAEQASAEASQAEVARTARQMR